MSSRKKRKAQQEDCAVCIIHSAKSGLEKSSQLRHYKSHPNSKVLMHKLEIPGKFQRICFCRWRLLPACCMAVKRPPV